MEKNAALEFCTQWLAAWSGNKPDELIQFYDLTAYYQDPAHPQGLAGKENIFNYFKKLLAKYPIWTWKPIEVFPFQSGFILKWETKINPQQKEKICGLDIVELKNNKIIRNEVYFDPRLLTLNNPSSMAR